MIDVINVVEIDTGQDGKHKGLQSGDEEFESDQGNGCEHWNNRSNRNNAAFCGQERCENSEEFQHNVTRNHIGEQTDGQCDWAADK